MAGMTKQEQFLWGVQTLLLLYANHHALDANVRADPTHISAAGNVVTVHMALAASKRIPDELDVTDAIHQFHFAYVHQSRDGSQPDIPGWLFGLK